MDQKLVWLSFSIDPLCVPNRKRSCQFHVDLAWNDPLMQLYNYLCFPGALGNVEAILATSSHPSLYLDVVLDITIG